MTPAETTAQMQRLRERIPPGNDLRIENHDDHEPDDHLSHGEQAGLDKRRSAADYGGAL